ncbi:hypothetical protein F2Q70_00026882 [Brassica cretica]|uniref:Uncharacterized protein n=1 Tax=Brassica cretica TaxID=69181 RepID=A0A8S9LAP1_BRACR|nr:hypothetical protein F2Q70_00026882 [Brassica cretica]
MRCSCLSKGDATWLMHEWAWDQMVQLGLSVSQGMGHSWKCDTLENGMGKCVIKPRSYSTRYLMLWRYLVIGNVMRDVTDVPYGNAYGMSSLGNMANPLRKSNLGIE